MGEICSLFLVPVSWRLSFHNNLTSGFSCVPGNPSICLDTMFLKDMGMNVSMCSAGGAPVLVSGWLPKLFCVVGGLLLCTEVTGVLRGQQQGSHLGLQES